MFLVLLGKFRSDFLAFRDSRNVKCLRNVNEACDPSLLETTGIAVKSELVAQLVEQRTFNP